MKQPVNVIENDMSSFLEICVEWYVDIAGANAKTVKEVPTALMMTALLEYRVCVPCDQLSVDCVKALRGLACYMDATKA